MAYGKLYLVPTPIGNLKDITLRALEVLQNADIIAAEDTRQTLKLLNHFNIKKKLYSYHQHNEQGQSENIITKLAEGLNIALVSDAGTPGISDPGSVIVAKCIEKGIAFEVLPGATAITTAVVYSGLDTTKFLFRGFLPRENKDRKIIIEEIINAKETLVFYEAPHRLLDTLTYLKDTLGNRKIAACRELTKLHEEIVRGSIEDCINHFVEKRPRGEFVLVVEGKSEEEIKAEKEALWSDLTIQDHILKTIESGIDKKQAIKIVAKERNLPKNEVYKYSTEL
ncbi:16S rRNA (cytidine(1402)-2'-O)-methyltransferase [Clostridium gasigenes]|uniref:Ribosomal RNA small subunit methyltransferase I n=1 Tax=Clostridium gasigenes TaxID=94869 RepID=A0A1H0QTL9_9CLOT|nr:16S rRNA (cytidine(1402)-2'-O)-methyltransferase [Clostridium gasigenes]MBB6625119.1 16S rRNA (cytidine(1402)-2'-O)-methyltransferase [Clostridium gasigenes]MBB6716595.1 16S rRNA (cytidine(1402)-2'-O)-methyltransferase [Clostridium gasigenes]MBU3089084.1 16S rRNA (cytidine(1402)-2'-O)-methyltransferase [Clostridium gasigenes]MBU3104451.1 16S rRNA (cytidine(1402)-2'-O)-methyltransferase [Clostridium gasigenes]MBU3108124.1 16S rRNA (cytidine(1402)-2'-O)-methyltransferase [Clostridium gasigene